MPNLLPTWEKRDQETITNTGISRLGLSLPELDREISELFPHWQIGRFFWMTCLCEDYLDKTLVSVWKAFLVSQSNHEQPSSIPFFCFKWSKIIYKPYLCKKLEKFLSLILEIWIFNRSWNVTCIVKIKKFKTVSRIGRIKNGF